MPAGFYKVELVVVAEYDRAWPDLLGAELGDLGRRIALGLAARDLEGLAINEDAFVVGEFADDVPGRLLGERECTWPAVRAVAARPTTNSAVLGTM